MHFEQSAKNHAVGLQVDHKNAGFGRLVRAAHDTKRWVRASPPPPRFGPKKALFGSTGGEYWGGGGAPFLVFFWGVLRVFWDLFVVPVNKLCVLCAAGAKGSETCPMRRSFWVKKWQKRGQSAKITTKPKRGLKM